MLKISSNTPIEIELISKIKPSQQYMIHVSSNSMKPIFEVGDMLTVVNNPISQVTKYQIIVYYHPTTKTLNTHRIIYIININNQIKLFTKGDNNIKKDALPVTKSIFLGTVITIKKRGTTINLLTHTYPWLRYQLFNQTCPKLKKILLNLIASFQ